MWQHMKSRKAVLIVSPKGSGFKLKSASHTIKVEPKFNEICRMVQPAIAGEWVRVWDEERKVGYMLKGDESWVSYEEE